MRWNKFYKFDNSAKLFKMKTFIVFFSFFLLVNTANSQDVIRGTVLNAKTNEPVEFVSVFVEGTLLGVSTDELGNFKLNYAYTNKNQKVIFQRLGYVSDTVEVEQILLQKKVLIMPTEQTIDEVVIYPVNAFDLLQKALENIPKNYYSKPILQKAFYRQYGVANNDLIAFEEADFSMVNFFNEKTKRDYVSVEKARGMIDFEVIKSLGKLVEKNIKDDSLFILDNAALLKAFNPNYERLIEDKKSFFGEKGDKQYVYSYNGLMLKDDRVVHYVSFDQKEKLKKTLFRGNVYIDTATLAIVETEVELSPKGVDFQKLLPLKFRLLVKLLGFSIEIYNIKFRAHYSLHNNFWVVKDGDYLISGKISKKNGISIAGDFVAEYWVKENLPQQSFTKKSSEYDIILPSLEPFKDADFWDSKNKFPLNSNVKKLLDKQLK